MPTTRLALHTRFFRSSVLLPVGVAVLLFACYWATLAPTVSGGDSGELAAAVHVMGVAHPTGYPLYLMVGKLFDLLPWGEPAWRLGLFSAVATAGAGALIAWSLVALTGSLAAGLLGGLVAGLNLWVWANANQAEVYGLHALLVCLAIAAFVRWRAQPGYGRLDLVAVAAGLGLAHHRTSVFFTLPLLAWAMAATRPVCWRRLARSLGWGAAPLLLYLWLPWRSAHHPPLDWGYTSGSLANFWEHVSGGAYFQWYAFQQPPAEAWAGLRSWLALLGKQVTPLGLALAVLGAGYLLGRERRPVGVCLLASFALVTAWASLYQVGDQWVFYLAPTLVVAAWCGAGLGAVGRLAARLKVGPGLARVLPAVGMAVAALIPMNMALQNWAGLDRSQDYRIREQGELMLAGVPANAVVLLIGDEPNFMASYYYHALGRRPVPTVLCASRCSAPWYEHEIPERLRPAAVRARAREYNDRPHWVAAEMRAGLEPDRPLYTNVNPAYVPPGYVVLGDYPIRRLVRAPGLAPERGLPPGKPLLALPRQAGALQALGLPAAVRRGEPFPITAAITWRGSKVPADLLLFFVHESIARDFAEYPLGFVVDQGLFDRRAVPVLFRLDPPPTPPGAYYPQRCYALAPRALRAGSYRVFVRAVGGGQETGLAAAGRLEIR